ncbi:hypothetical protein F66182_1468 [Fusarium sp. NRRL 66182]|nr:hypothetical protein F66182_1468 [Fusarium sp. NRRL 66182]
MISSKTSRERNSYKPIFYPVYSQSPDIPMALYRRTTPETHFLPFLIILLCITITITILIMSRSPWRKLSDKETDPQHGTLAKVARAHKDESTVYSQDSTDNLSNRPSFAASGRRLTPPKPKLTKPEPVPAEEKTPSEGTKNRKTDSEKSGFLGNLDMNDFEDIALQSPSPDQSMESLRNELSNETYDIKEYWYI